MTSLEADRNGATLVRMRRGILCVLLVTACFDEPTDKVAVPVTTVADDDGDEESSSSESTAGSSSEGESSSSGWDTIGAAGCPDWCADFGYFCEEVGPSQTVLCRCYTDDSCGDGTHCEGAVTDPPMPMAGHCV